MWTLEVMIGAFYFKYIELWIRRNWFSLYRLIFESKSEIKVPILFYKNMEENGNSNIVYLFAINWFIL
jgi:hypothetical protein